MTSRQSQPAAGPFPRPFSLESVSITLLYTRQVSDIFPARMCLPFRLTTTIGRDSHRDTRQPFCPSPNWCHQPEWR